jgi:osmotically inducible protein OsmC
VPRIERSARAVWEGSSAKGSGILSAETGAFAALAISEPTRVADPRGQTSPEELLAAAHGGCITMSLASELTQAGTPPGRLAVTCLIVMDEVEGQGHQIVASHVEMLATADGLDDEGLQAAVAKADQGCPFSNLLERAGVEVVVTAKLA